MCSDYLVFDCDGATFERGGQLYDLHDPHQKVSGLSLHLPYWLQLVDSALIDKAIMPIMLSHPYHGGEHAWLFFRILVGLEETAHVIQQQLVQRRRDLRRLGTSELLRYLDCEVPEGLRPARTMEADL